MGTTDDIRIGAGKWVLWREYARRDAHSVSFKQLLNLFFAPRAGLLISGVVVRTSTEHLSYVPATSCLDCCC